MKSITSEIGNVLNFSSFDHPLDKERNFYDKLIQENISGTYWDFLCSAYYDSYDFMREFPLIRNV
jgi:hypothetical protein